MPCLALCLTSNRRTRRIPVLPRPFSHSNIERAFTYILRVVPSMRGIGIGSPFLVTYALESLAALRPASNPSQPPSTHTHGVNGYTGILFQQMGMTRPTRTCSSFPAGWWGAGRCGAATWRGTFLCQVGSTFGSRRSSGMPSVSGLGWGWVWLVLHELVLQWC